MDAAWLASGRLRARGDLSLTPTPEGVVVKDPLSLEYFRLGDRERFLLDELAQPLTINELTRRYQRRYPNEKSTGAQVLAFCASLYDCALLLSDQPLSAEAIKKRDAGSRAWYAGLLSPLSIRLPGVDPTPLLKRLEGVGRVIFSRWFAGTLTLAAMLVGAALLGRFEEALADSARLVDLFEPTHAVAAMVAVMIAKTWHELGHAMACRRMGAECHEVGVLLLVLFPCLYCDASDAWTLPSRWRRTVVALAGVYFEAILAVAAVAAWLVLAPGPLRVLALYLVVITSISTVLINLNPLMRFDGYYVLADAWGVANLHQQSRAALWGPIGRWVRGDRGPAEIFDASPWLLAAYGAAALTYGWMILAVILWAVYQALAAAGFAAAGDLLVALTLGGVAFAGARSLSRQIPRGPGGRSLAAAVRFAVVAAVAFAGLWLLAVTPIEQTLHAPCRITSPQAAEIVARSEGVLVPHVRYGDVVRAGGLIADLSDPVEELRRLELREREAGLVAELDGLRTRSQRDAKLLSEIARIEPTLAEVRRQLRSHEQQTESRRLRAPIAGRVTRPPPRAASTQEETAEGELPTWGGAPLDPPNQGCLLRPGETVCRVVGEGLQGVLLLGQNDSGLVRLGDRVRVALDRSPGEVCEAEVTGVALAPAEYDNGLADAERRLERTIRDPLERDAAYRVTIEFGSTIPSAGQPGARGQARIVTGEETLGGWCLRWLRRLVRFGSV